MTEDNGQPWGEIADGLRADVAEGRLTLDVAAAALHQVVTKRGISVTPAGCRQSVDPYAVPEVPESEVRQ